MVVTEMNLRVSPKMEKASEMEKALIAGRNR